MANEQEEFARRVQSILDAIEKHEKSSLEAALRLLEQTRREVVADIAQGGSEFNLSVLRQVRTAIEMRIEEFTRELGLELNRDLSTSFDLGNRLADEPLSVYVSAPIANVSREAIQVASEFTMMLIKGVSNDLQDRINAVLRRAVIGSMSPAQAIAEVGKSLSDPGPFRTIAARAETIVRTEVLRIQAIATHARMVAHKQTMARAGYTLKKQWLATEDLRTRKWHGLPLGADGQVKEIEEPFIVPPEGGEELMYPRDPAGSPENTINCRCSSIPVVEKAA